MSEIIAERAEGEWRVQERSSYFGVFTRASKNWYDKVRLVAVCAKPHPDALANATIISAAPNMKDTGEFLLFRLDEFERELSDDDVAREWFGHVAPAIANFRSALAKAGRLALSDSKENDRG